MSRRTHARLRHTLCLTLRNARVTNCFFHNMRNTSTKHSCKMQCGSINFSTAHKQLPAGFFANAFACSIGKRSLLTAHHLRLLGHIPVLPRFRSKSHTGKTMTPPFSTLLRHASTRAPILTGTYPSRRLHLQALQHLSHRCRCHSCSSTPPCTAYDFGRACRPPRPYFVLR